MEYVMPEANVDYFSEVFSDSSDRWESDIDLDDGNG